MICPQLSNPEIKEKFNKLISAVGEPMAYFLYDKNGGNFLDKDINGNDSQLYKDLLLLTNNDGNQSIILKSQIYSSNFKKQNQEQTEPSISELDTRKRQYDEPKVKLFKYRKYPQKPTKLTRNTHYLLRRNPGETKAYYIPGYPKDSNKRKIASMFFRYSHPVGESEKNAWPMYPYTLPGLDNKKNNEYADWINSHFDRRVVGVDYTSDNGIIFMPNVEDAKYIGSDLEFNMPEEFDKPVETKEEIPTKIKINEVISLIKKKIVLLERRIQKTGGNSNMRANLASYQAQIKKLEREQIKGEAPSILENIANQDAEAIENGFAHIESNIEIIDDLNGQQILNLIDSINQASYTIKGWVDIQDYVSHTEPELIEKLGKVHWRYIKLNEKYNELLSTLYTEYANRYSSRSDFSKDEILQAVEDMKYAKFLNIGTSDIALLKITDDLIRKTELETNLELMDKESEVSEWEDKLNKAGYSRAKVAELLKQKYNGQWTGNIVGEIKHDYYIERDKMLDRGPREFFDWLNNNSKRLSRNIFLEVSEGKYDNALKLGYTTEELNIQKELAQEYLRDKKAYEETLKIRFGEDSSIIKQELDDWASDNSPVLYLQNRMNNGSMYLIPEKPNVSKWGDKDYSSFPQTVKDFHKFVVNRFNENNKHIGYFNQYLENYLPEQETTFLQQLTKSNVNKKSFIWNKLKSIFTDEVKSIEDSRILIGNNEIKSVKVGMMDDKIHPSMKESDIFTILNSHTKMSLAYKHKTKIEPMANAATYLLDTLKEIELVDTGTGEMEKRQKFGTTEEKKNRLTNAKDALRYYIDKQLYGIGKKVEGRIGSPIEVEEQVKGDDGELTTVKKKANVTASSLGDFLIGYAYTKTMSIPNFISPVVNAAFGVNSLLAYAARKEDFNESQAISAIFKMTTATSKTLGGLANPDLVNKVYAFMNTFSLLGKIHDTDFIKKRTIQEKILILQEKAETFVQGATMIAALEGIKLKDKNGNTVPAFDAFKYDKGRLVWDVDKMGEKSETPNDRLYSEDLHGINLFNLNKKVDEINRIVSGDYKTPMMFKENITGRLIAMYKTWMPYAVKTRFGKTEISRNFEDKTGKMGRVIKGRYRSFYTSKTQDGINVTIFNAIGMLLKEFMFIKSFNKLSDVDAANMRANLMEIRQIAAIYLMIAIMKAAFMDDDDERKPGLNLAINTMTKAGADLSFFLSPFSLQQVTSNIIPVTSTLIDIQKAITNINGPNTLKLIPLSSGAVKMYNLGSRTVAYY